MDSDAWRPFDPVDVKRRVAPGRGAATIGSFVERPPDDVDDDGGATTAISLPAAGITLGWMGAW